MNTSKFLTGKTALITGGASGMGRAMALALASAGANIAIGSLLGRDRVVEGEIVHTPSQTELEQAATEIRSRNVQVLSSNLDVCEQSSVEAFYQATVAEFGQVDILVNAAGITVEQTVVGHPDSMWNKVIDVNLNGTYRMVKTCLSGMIERRWGRIVNIASTAASVGAPTSAAYCASKAGVVGLSRCVALEGAPHGVTCNTISPGWVDTSFGNKWMTDINDQQDSTNDYIEETIASNPQNRLIQPEEIGQLCLYLCREEAKGMTMQDLTVSAGSLW